MDPIIRGMIYNKLKDLKPYQFVSVVFDDAIEEELKGVKNREETLLTIYNYHILNTGFTPTKEREAINDIHPLVKEWFDILHENQTLDINGPDMFDLLSEFYDRHFKARNVKFDDFCEVMKSRDMTRTVKHDILTV